MSDNPYKHYHGPERDDADGPCYACAWNEGQAAGMEVWRKVAEKNCDTCEDAGATTERARIVAAIEQELRHWNDTVPRATVVRLLRQIRGTAAPCPLAAMEASEPGESPPPTPATPEDER